MPAAQTSVPTATHTRTGNQSWESAVWVKPEEREAKDAVAVLASVSPTVMPSLLMI